MNLRHQKILSVLNEDKFSSVPDLASVLEVSEMTVRRDLITLESSGYLKRIHGGAMLIPAQKKIKFFSGSEKEIIDLDKKRAIAKVAVQFLEPNDFVYIDSGTTAEVFASVIAESEGIVMSAITNSVIVAKTLAYKQGVDIYLCGGRLHTMHCSLIGLLAEETLKKFNYNKAFISAGGISLLSGITVRNIDEIPVKKTVAENTKQLIVLADSSKFEKTVLSAVIPFEKVNTIITDWEIKDSYLEEFVKNGTVVIVAKKS